MLRTTRASSDIRLGQGGSQTTLTSTFPTPGTVETAFSTITGTSCADGQLGEVSDMSTFTTLWLKPDPKREAPRMNANERR
jgi:hypothetical protein